MHAPADQRDQAPLPGRAAIVEFFRGIGDRPGAPDSSATAGRRIVRHHVSNIRFLEVRSDEARVECYFAVLTEIGLDHYGRYRDHFVPVGDEWLILHRFVSTDWHAPGSTMVRTAPPS